MNKKLKMYMIIIYIYIYMFILQMKNLSRYAVRLIVIRHIGP